jgi:RHS repeat-associated protein
MYDEAGHLLGEYSSTGTLVEETIWLGDIPVATLRPSGSSVAVYYVEADNLKTPRQVTRPSDNKQMWTWFSDPFGTTAANSNPAGAGTFTYNLRFPGQIFDSQAGLQQNWNRDYDPAIGRYVESDPTGQRIYVDFARFAGFKTQRGYWNHLYDYVDNDPVMARDPQGLLPAWLDWFLDFFNDKAPEVAASKAIGSGLSAICITRNCGKTRGDTELLGDCTSYLSDWAKGHPELMGAIGGITSDGAAAAVSDCAELCAKGINSGSCGCQKGSP